jgi:hypothetical protein
MKSSLDRSRPRTGPPFRERPPRLLADSMVHEAKHGVVASSFSSSVMPGTKMFFESHGPKLLGCNKLQLFADPRTETAER